MPSSELSDGTLAYAFGLVNAEIKRHQKSIDAFTPRPGQSPEDAAAVLAEFKRNQQFRVLAYDELRRAHYLALGYVPSTATCGCGEPKGHAGSYSSCRLTWLERADGLTAQVVLWYD